MNVVPVNYWAILVAAIVNVIIGGLWFGPLFGKSWQKLMGFDQKSMKEMPMSPMKAMFGGLVIALIMSYVLRHDIVFATTYFGLSQTTSAGLSAAFWQWLGFAVPLTMGVVLWENKSWKLWILTAGYWLVAMLSMGAILVQ